MNDAPKRVKGRRLLASSVLVLAFATAQALRAGEGTVPEGEEARAGGETLLEPAEGGDEGGAASGAEETRAGETSGFLGLPLELGGGLTQRYRFRRTAAETDQDLYGHLALDALYPVRASRLSEVGFHLAASYNLDIDSFRSGVAPGAVFFPFADVTNTFPDRLLLFLHEAYVEAKDASVFGSVRAGRQLIHREEGLLFDGAYLRTKEWKALSFDLFGGVPAHLYERSASGDALGGGGVTWRPLRGLEVGADYYFIRDERGYAPTGEEHVSILRGKYRFLEGWSASASASWVDTRDRRQTLNVEYVSAATGFSFRGRAVRQNAIVDFQSSDISPFIFVQGSYAPYYQYEADLHQPLGERFGLGGGFRVRHLEDGSDEGLFNHSFRNAYLVFDTHDLWPGMSASIQGDLWDSDEDDIYSVGFELEQAVSRVRVSAGTSFALYRIDLFTGTEREQDRIYYVKLRWRLLDFLDLDAKYEYERDSVTEYHTVTGGFRLWF